MYLNKGYWFLEIKDYPDAWIIFCFYSIIRNREIVIFWGGKNGKF
jgi:hypothetical protein